MNEFNVGLNVGEHNILVIRLTTFLVTFFLFATISNAQVAETTELFKTLKVKDSLMFNVGFNKCDIEVLKMLTDETLEFYHDTGGASYSQMEFIKNIENNLCKSGINQLRRELVQGSLKVFPLHNNDVLYGAIQMGNHRFTNADSDNSENSTEAKFIHLWIIKGGEWKINRVLSYNHKND